MQDIRDKINTIIQDRAHKQSTIAERAGLTPMMFSDMLKHRRKLDANELFRVCDALGMTPNDVMDYQPKQEK